MKRIPYYLLIVLAGFFFASCDNSKTESPPANEQVEADSSASESPARSRDSALSATPDSAPPAVEEVVMNETFDQKATRFMETVLPDYKKVEMEPMDAFPKFSKARNSFFRRMRKSKSISNEYGRGVYPRVMFKAYRFGSEPDLDKEVKEWLNGHDSSDDDIELGEAVDALKSPPLLCGIVGKEFYMIQSGCVYKGKEMDTMTEAFHGLMEKEKARYAFTVTCAAGKIEYRIGGK